MKRTRSDTCNRGHSLADAFLDNRSGYLNCRVCARARTKKHREYPSSPDGTRARWQALIGPMRQRLRDEIAQDEGRR